MKFVLAILALAWAVGMASAVVELSGTDFDKAFSDPKMQNDGVGRDMGSVTWGTPAGWNDASDGTPYGGKSPALLGSLAKDAYFGSQEKANIPKYAAQVEDYLNETLNRSGVTIIDDLNVTNNTAEA